MLFFFEYKCLDTLRSKFFSSSQLSQYRPLDIALLLLLLINSIPRQIDPTNNETESFSDWRRWIQRRNRRGTWSGVQLVERHLRPTHLVTTLTLCQRKRTFKVVNDSRWLVRSITKPSSSSTMDQILRLLVTVWVFHSSEAMVKINIVPVCFAREPWLDPINAMIG